MHIKDIDAVVSWMKKKTKLPIWLVGISLGSISAASYAVRGNQSIAGVVLMSSPTNPPHPRRRSVAEMGLDKIKVPVLAIAHGGDKCAGTPPAGAKKIVEASTSSPNAKAIIFTGGHDSGGNPCRPGTHHTFDGIEQEVVSAIAAFIKTNTK